MKPTDEKWGGTLTITLELVNRNVAGMMLEHWGYEVFTTSDGENPIKIYNENSEKIKAIIPGIVMPSMYGDETFMRILKSHSHANIIVSSGFRNEIWVKNLLMQEPDSSCRNYIRWEYCQKS
jgi:DNA-binding NtrC family response regulator